ncbi:MAG: hypothetical protein LC798_13170 [Chloroflexi bacterium]|nr:hypothetical protein [Chloroflexota bacterium]
MTKAKKRLEKDDGITAVPAVKPVHEDKALLTGALVRECPACLDLGERRYFLEVGYRATGLEVRCSTGHRYAIRLYTYGLAGDTFELHRRLP